MELTVKNLHDNYLKILKFMDPETFIKSWVHDDEEATGHYHDEIDWVFPVVSKIELLSNNQVIIDFKIQNGITELLVYDAKVSKNYLLYHKLRTNHHDHLKSKIQNIYQTVITFIDWYNEKMMTESIRFDLPYTAPDEILYFVKTDIKKKRQFENNLNITSLKMKVAEIFNISLAQLESKTRIQEYVKARQLAMTILHYDGYSLERAAAFFGKDHATALNGKRCILNILETKDYLYHSKVIEVLDFYGIREGVEKLYKHE